MIPLTFKPITNGSEISNSVKVIGKIVWHGCQNEYVFVPEKLIPCYYIDYMNDILVAMRMLQTERQKIIETVGT